LRADLLKSCIWSAGEKPVNWYVLPLVIIVLLNAFSAVTTLMSFQFNLDNHVMECQQVLHHDQNCQAKCILEEMMDQSEESNKEKSISIFHGIPDLFFQTYQMIELALMDEVRDSHVVCHYLLHYAPPDLAVHSPPPKV
jgi:hypothetical protein